MKTVAIIGLFLGFSFAGVVTAQDGLVQGGTSVDAMWGHPAPSYLILPRPLTHANKGQPHTYVAPKNPIESKPASPYAYGWFGTKPSPHWHRQFGSQNAYTQWTLK
jgi:hypothetical protein